LHHDGAWQKRPHQIGVYASAHLPRRRCIAEEQRGIMLAWNLRFHAPEDSRNRRDQGDDRGALNINTSMNNEKEGMTTCPTTR
jgi:hypothetical protein